VFAFFKGRKSLVLSSMRIEDIILLVLSAVHIHSIHIYITNGDVIHNALSGYLFVCSAHFTVDFFFFFGKPVTISVHVCNASTCK